MTLCDAGPLVALIDCNDDHHARCMAALTTLPPGPLLTTWPCVTEAMHLLRRTGGNAAQNELWQLISDGLVVVRDPDPAESPRMRELMTQYVDAPMDLADAPLVAAAERLGVRRVFTVDRHFYAFRVGGTDAFEVMS